jgi:group I intron endonuclease
MNYNFFDNFPVLAQFDDLHLPKNLKAAKLALKGLSGIYAIVHVPTGCAYIGSSVDIGRRLNSHIYDYSTNIHLRNSLNKHGLNEFIFCVLEKCAREQLISREQHFLDILFSIPEELRYNFLANAYSLLGYRHTEEALAKISEAMTGRTLSGDTRAKMSDAKTGTNNPMLGKVPTNAFPAGVNNPKFGITPTNAMSIYVYDLDYVLLNTFTSQVAAAEWLNTSRWTVMRYLRSGKVWNNQYLFFSRNTPVK